MTENSKSDAPELKALGASAYNNYQYDHPSVEVLEWFENPLLKFDPDYVRDMDRLRDGEIPLREGQAGILQDAQSRLILRIESPEFTSLCPKTGQPDFAVIKIAYQPRNRCVESKSLKLYLMGYRNHGSFHEACVVQIGKDLVEVLEPEWLEVVGEFTPRGGIPFWPTFSYSRNHNDSI